MRKCREPLKGVFLHLYNEGADHCLVTIRGMMGSELQFRLNWEYNIMILKHFEQTQLN